ncbi:DEAH (Asp-Glu-Ala-His) box polypeptide 34 [Podochytrium sp. JEL0797]|nr:DEAH (Asp-Glu-Ala-His) box polypeptide 34 [Podochytrium sp. JEL0797]
MQANPWPPSVDRALFSRDEPLAEFKRHGPEYADFKDFYAKFRSRSSNVSLSSKDDELRFATRALELFKDYQKKRRDAAQEKMRKDRASLPIAPFEQQLVSLVRANRVVLIAAQTGAGKSTQESLDALKYGTDIAFQVRFEGTKTQNTKILFLTEGLLLRQFAQDPQLQSYNLIIVDEVHERHVTGDFLLGVLKRILETRSDLRVVLMSATINAELFANYFNAPVIEIPGRMFPVKIEYLPVSQEEDRNLVDPRLVQERSGTVVSIQAKPGKLVADPYLRILERIDQVVPAHERGDLLVFLSGMNEIQTLAEELRNYASFTRRWIILKLHSSLSIQEQEKVFDVAPPGLRKCIISTNICETSVTVDGVRFIIDAGRVKEMSFNATTRMNRLSEFYISQSSAKQRTGRAGRTGPGECFRFYSEREYNAFNVFPVPEILRTPLEPLLLQCMAYGLGDPREFEFIEKPAAVAVEGAMSSLKDLGAIEEMQSSREEGAKRERLTSLGKVLAVLPMDVVLGKMLVLGSMSDVVDAVVVMAAALTVPNPFVRVPENRIDITDNRTSLQSDYGDPFTLMNLFSVWLKVKAENRESSKNWCKRFGVEEQRLYEMVKLKNQFEEVLAQYLGREEEGGEEEGGEIDSDEDYETFRRREQMRKRKKGGKRRRESKEDGGEEGGEMDEAEKLKRRMFWKDPVYIKRKEQRLLLEQQKRNQTAGKRKFLTFEDGDLEDEDGGREPAEPKDMADLSVHHLEFSLNNDPSALLAKSDASNLTKRDANLVRLVICSGLYPHIAIPDESNAFRPASEQVYHTKTKRFVKMLPTSVFCMKPELLHPKQLPTAPPPPPQSTDQEPPKETLDSIRPKQQTTELLCYLELLETNKPYLTNVLRVPAVPICLLFAHRLDINHDMTHVIVDSWLHLHFRNPKSCERVLVLGNWHKTAWDHVLGRRLQNVSLGLNCRNNAAGSEEEEEEVEEEIELMGTAVGRGGVSEVLGEEEKGGEREGGRLGGTTIKKRVPSDWADVAFLPMGMKRIRFDWEMGTTRCEEGVVAGEDFESLTDYDLSKHLGEFVDIDFECSVERLRMQDVPDWFGYDPFKTDASTSNAFNYSQPPPATASAGASDKKFKGEILITPQIHFFVANPSVLKSLSIKKRAKLECNGPSIIEVEASRLDAEDFEQPVGPAFEKSLKPEVVLQDAVVADVQEQGVGEQVVMGCETAAAANRRTFVCRVCGHEVVGSVVDILRHKRACKQ